MLAKETDTPFDDKDWLFELKWNGYSAISEIKNGEIVIINEEGKSDFQNLQHYEDNTQFTAWINYRNGLCRIISTHKGIIALFILLIDDVSPKLHL